MSQTRTKGDLIVEEIKVGDVIYEFDLGLCIKTTVSTLPKLNANNQWEWTSKYKDGKEVHYLVDPKYPHYSANLYNNMAYKVNIVIE